MTKDKNFKKIAKLAFEDKIKNIIFMMKFLDSKGGLEEVEEYFAQAIPSYVMEFEGIGDAKKWLLRQLAKSDPHGYMTKITDKVKKDSQFIIPLENYVMLEDVKDRISFQISCKFMKSMVKQGRKFQCDFDVRNYYCTNACIPILSKVYADIYLNIDVELNENGCTQTISVDELGLKGEK
ncbi:MAG: hypothetical protein ACTSRW_04055 [Candidatus Helarchaeota archaeon]